MGYYCCLLLFFVLFLKLTRDLFQEAQDYGSPYLKKIQLDTLTTLVDASIFLNLFGTDQSISEYKDLAVRPGDEQQLEEQGSGMRKITELLLEQVECAG